MVILEAENEFVDDDLDQHLIMGMRLSKATVAFEEPRQNVG